MPRRSGRTSTATSVHFPTPEQATLPPATCLDPNLAVLRTQWKWAAFCQFTTIFSSLLNIPDVTITDIESDLAFGSRRTIPRLMQRLLYTLSYDRKISLENWQTALRKQYLKRDPSSNPLGCEPPREQTTTESRGDTPEDHDVELHQGDLGQEPLENPSNELEVKPQPGKSSATSEASRAVTQEAEDNTQSNGTQVSTDWFDLPLLAKLDSLHLLTEWQFQNPMRLRTLMRSDDDLATWRHEPIGYDSKKNAYWLIGGDRLWIQRVPQKPVKTLKRKRPNEKQKTLGPEKAKSSKRQRTKAMAKTDETSSRSGRGRAAKLQAKIKLDIQARELAELNRQAKGKQVSRSSQNSAKQAPQSLGTRVSARLRGVQTSEWQPIPDEWLETHERQNQSETGDRRSRDKKQAHNDQEDSVSELTELSDDSDNPDTSDERPATPKEKIIIVKDEDRDSTMETEKALPEGLVEWETICVTLEEWEHIAERFEKATHYLEKALYKYLTTEIVPNITSTLREVEKKKRLEDALVRRKRSSRIALRESEREEARCAAQRQAEEAERMGRARRLEARRQREEEERLRREQAREQRRKEREAREIRRQAESEQHEDQSSDNGTDAEPITTNTFPVATTQALLGSHKMGKLQGLRQLSKAIKTSDWELDCEICYKRGMNLDDNTPMMSCGKCSKWQHIICHDLADERAGRAKRNWDVVEFLCQKCRSRMFAGTEPSNSSFRDLRHANHPPHNVNPHPPFQNSASYQSYLTQGYGVTPPSNISTLYHAAKGSYSHYTQPYGNTRASGIPDRYPTASQSYIPPYPYNQQPSPISFSHYQPQEGGFNSSSKSHAAYPVHSVETYRQHTHSAQHTPYSDLRSNSSQGLPAPPPTQTVWSITTPTNGSYTMPYQNMVHNNMVPRRELQQPIPKPGSSSPSDFNHQVYPNTQFRYHPRT